MTGVAKPAPCRLLHAGLAVGKATTWRGDYPGIFLPGASAPQRGIQLGEPFRCTDIGPAASVVLAGNGTTRHQCAQQWRQLEARRSLVGSMGSESLIFCEKGVRDN